MPPSTSTSLLRPDTPRPGVNYLALAESPLVQCTRPDTKTAGHSPGHEPVMSVAVPESDPERFSAKEPTLRSEKVYVSAVANGWLPSAGRTESASTGMLAVAP